MAGMPEMQEHFPAMAKDGRYAGNAGAFSGDGQGWPVCRPAGAPCTCGHFPHPCGSEMQEHFPAMAKDGRYAGPPVLPAPAGTSHIRVGRKSRSTPATPLAQSVTT